MGRLLGIGILSDKDQKEPLNSSGHFLIYRLSYGNTKKLVNF